MTEINTTRIMDLPTDPINGGSVGGNVHMNTNEIVNTEQKGSFTLDQSTISQIVNGLQQANSSGATSLPSRDIPQTTEQLTQDESVRVNYIPPTQVKDYINDSDEDIIGSYHRQEKIENTLDLVYDEFQGPLLLAILYFIFQLPFFKKNICKYLTFLCNSDGNYNLNGLILTSSLFGFTYYSLAKTMVHFSKF
jgi:hypothetical protein